MPEPILAPSLLAADHGRLADALQTVEAAGARWLHIDIMDGHFVPNLSFGPQTVADLRGQTDLFFDVHLMLGNPQDHIEAFAKAGSDRITIHVEPRYDIAATLARIQEMGKRAGIALNPRTPLSEVEPYLDQVDLALAMTVQPGFGGQSFDASALEKTRQLAEWREERGLDFRIEVDGGINLDTGARCRATGVDTLVAGTAFFKAEDRVAFRRAIEQSARPR